MKKRLLPLLLAAVMLLALLPMSGAGYSEMSFSDKMVEYIKQGEGFSAVPYSDGTGWYIGYGSACNPSDYPNGISEAEAEALLRAKMQLFADHANSFLSRHGVGVTQGQFDAMCSMSYNLGTGWLSTSNRLPSYIVNGVEKYTEKQIMDAFAAWCHIGSEANQNLLGRRIIEAKMFLYEDYSFNTDGWSWVIMDAAGGDVDPSDVAVFKTLGTYEGLPTPTRSGYTFAGWYGTDGKLISEDDTVVENRLLTAKWTQGEGGEDKEDKEETPSAPDEDSRPETPDVPGGEYVPPVKSYYPDVPEFEWYYSYISRLTDEGVVEGYDDGTFRPDARVTWGQALKLIILAVGYEEQEPVELPYGAPSHWASGYLAFAEEKGFVAEDSVANLDAEISRNSIADLAAAVMEIEASPGAVNPFDDTSRPSVLALFEAGIMEGSRENGLRLFKGGDNIKRSEMCAVICRILDYARENILIYLGYNVKIDHSLEKCTYNMDSFYNLNGRVYYQDYYAGVRYGIDVSEHQGLIDWQAVAADGIDFAMIRAGYRGYSEGALSEDACFRYNIESALAAGLDVGVYFFSQALDVAEALEEFNFLMGLIRGYDITFPVVFDWESVSYAGSRTRVYDPKVVDDCILVFSEAVAAAGYTPMCYFSPSTAYLRHDLSRIDHIEAWLANYALVPNYIYDFQMWQYTSDGKVDGVSGRVDMNLCFVNYAE